MTHEGETGPRPDDSRIGYDLAHVTPSVVDALPPELIDPRRLDIREHDGYPPPDLSVDAFTSVLVGLGVEVWAGILAEANNHVTLTPRTTWVSGRGYLSLIRGWFLFGDANRADWVKDLDVAGGGGYLEIWLHGLTPGRQYVLDIKMTGAGQAADSAFKLGSSANFWASYPVSGFKALHLMAVLQPNDPMALISVEPVALTFASFHRATVKPI